MEITLEQYERIQNYLDGIMTPPEEKDFLIELDKNISFKESFEFERDLRQNLTSILDKKNIFDEENAYFKTDKKAEDYDSIKSLIEKAGNEWSEENKKFSSAAFNISDKESGPGKSKVVHIKSWSVITAAACIVIAIISLVWFSHKDSSTLIVKSNSTNDIKKDSGSTNIVKTIPNDSSKNINPGTQKINYSALFKKYYAKDTSNPKMPDMLAMVPANYRNGDYSFREIDLGKIPISRGSSNDINSKQNILQLAHYYKGLSYVETNDYKKAIENLQWVITNAINDQIKIKAQWYLALIYLKEGNKKANALLLSVSKNEKAIPYNRKATDILEGLNAQTNRK